MKNIAMVERSKQALENNALWEADVKAFLNTNNIPMPDEDVWEEISYEGTDYIALKEVNGHTVIYVSGWLCGEPNDSVYDMEWNAVGYSNEGTNFETVCIADWLEEDEAEEVPADVTVNEAVTENEIMVEEEKEEKTMMMITIATATMEEVMELARVTKITKLQDAEYVDKANMVELAKANGMEVNRKTTRAAALEFVKERGNIRFTELKKAEAPKQEAPKAEVPKANPTDAEAKKKEAQRKTVAFMRKVLNYAADNQKKGHGYTISGEYLKYFIFEVQFGVKKFKTYAEANSSTPDFAQKMEAAGKVAKWAINKGYIVPVTYKVTFDFGGKHFERCCYKPEFNGSEETKGKMFPIDKCVFAGSENVKWTATTYAVTEAAQAWR